ncbi:unnamed protein product [Ilex paraguariensis]|uniref:Uncharacterized protein n=1 Tax=Ilex paraguariensis TaxID=185542 RepID=A0ABC8QZZ6_9AQUA
MFNRSSGSSIVVSEKSHCSSGMNAETQKLSFNFFVQIVEPLLLKINTYSQAKLEFGPSLLEMHCALKATNNILASFIHENVYIRMEDTSEGACVNFLRVVYDMTMSVSAKTIELWPSNFVSNEGTYKEALHLIARELIVVLRCLLEIDYEVFEDDLETLWIMIFSYATHGLSLADGPDESLLTSNTIHLGCQLVNLYSELRQVNNIIFALCNAVRRLALPIRNGETCTPQYPYVAYAESLRTVLCSLELRLSIYNAIRSIPEGQASGFIRQLTSDISESLEWMKGKCSLAAGNEDLKPSVSSYSLPCNNLQAELLGRALSEVYIVILDSMIVTTGNSNLVSVAVKDLMAVIRPSMSSLVALEPDSVTKFLFMVIGRTYNQGTGVKFDFQSTHWIFIFFFRLYMSCRSLYRQTISLVAPDTSKKMSEIIGDTLTAYSGRDWLERTVWADKGYFSWIIQPSASLLTVIQAVSDIYLHDPVADCSPLIYVLNVMALQRLVDLNRLIKSFEYLLRRNTHLVQTKSTDDAELSMHLKKGRKWERCVSNLRQEATGLTNFMMEYLPLVAKDAWDFSFGSVNEKSLTSAIWWILCQNLDVWFTHVSKKKLKMFLSVLIQNSLPCLSSGLEDLGKHNISKHGHLKKVTAHQISLELLSNTLLYEQRVR